MPSNAMTDTSAASPTITGHEALAARQGARAKMPHVIDSRNIDECSLERR